MKAIAAELRSLLDQHTAAILAIPESKMIYKLSPLKWSKKEIMGHLADSAQNNIRRFIVAQYEENPKIVYNQDKWVSISHYQEYDTKELVNLWQLLNKHMAVILENTSPEMAQRECLSESPHTIEWLATDYIKHLKHHLHQVLELEPIPYP